MKRDEYFLRGSDAAFGTFEDCITKSVTALVRVKFSLYWLPSGIPYSITVLDIEIVTIAVNRGVVVSITCQAHEFCILEEAISSGCVGYEPEEVLRPEVVDPGKRGLRRRNDILTVDIVKITEFHKCFLSTNTFSFACIDYKEKMAVCKHHNRGRAII